MSKVWFVTGSSRGLGRAVVEVALEAGDNVVATARTPDLLIDLVARHGDRVLTVPLDVTDAAAAGHAVRAGLDRFGGLDVVVNNAGYGDLAAFEDMPSDMFRAQIETNFFGVVNVCRAVVPVLREQGSGHIFQVSSIGGRLASPGLTAYQSAKWAVGGFSTGLAGELAGFGVRVTVLEPGGMRTDWAGSSMTIPPVSEPYGPTVGAFAARLREMSGNEQTDTRLVAGVIRDLAGRADAPVRLLLGADAVSLAGTTARELAATDATWRPTGLSVAGTWS